MGLVLGVTYAKDHAKGEYEAKGQAHEEDVYPECRILERGSVC